MTSKKTPDDQPFDFNLDAVKNEKDKRPFRVNYGSKRWLMKHRELIDQIPILEAAERGGEAEATIVSLRAALDDQWPEFRKLGLTREQLQTLSDAYDKHCGTEQGESSGSTDS